LSTKFVQILFWGAQTLWFYTEMRGNLFFFIVGFSSTYCNIFTFSATVLSWRLRLFGLDISVKYRSQKARQRISHLKHWQPKKHWATNTTTDCYVIRAVEIPFSHPSDYDVTILWSTM